MTLILRVQSRYRAGRVEYQPGQVLHFPDVEGKRLLRDSPESFTIVDEEAEPDPERVTAMSTQTAGDFVPDRRVRGGRKRTASG